MARAGNSTTLGPANARRSGIARSRAVVHFTRPGILWRIRANRRSSRRPGSHAHSERFHALYGINCADQSKWDADEEWFRTGPGRRFPGAEACRAAIVNSCPQKSQVVCGRPSGELAVRRFRARCLRTAHENRHSWVTRQARTTLSRSRFGFPLLPQPGSTIVDTPLREINTLRGRLTWVVSCSR